MIKEVEKFKNNEDNNVDSIQKSLRCCGIFSSDDFKVNDLYKVPRSCCVSGELDERGQCTDAIVGFRGCLSAYESYINWYRNLCYVTLFIMFKLKLLFLLYSNRVNTQA